MTPKYPKNLDEYFPGGSNKDFAMWAFGTEQPGSNIKMKQAWEKMHPEFPMKDFDSVYICMCKMNYLFYFLQKEP